MSICFHPSDQKISWIRFGKIFQSTIRILLFPIYRYTDHAYLLPLPQNQLPSTSTFPKIGKNHCPSFFSFSPSSPSCQERATQNPSHILIVCCLPIQDLPIFALLAHESIEIEGKQSPIRITTGKMIQNHHQWLEKLKDSESIYFRD